MIDRHVHAVMHADGVTHPLLYRLILSRNKIRNYVGCVPRTIRRIKVVRGTHPT